MKRPALSTLAPLAVAAFAIAVSGCHAAVSAPPSGSSAPAANSPGSGASSAPAYQPLGGSATGVSVDVPSSWRVLDFSKITAQQAYTQLGLSGAVSESQWAQLVQLLVNDHGAEAIDTSSATTTSGYFADNVNDYCGASGVSQAGSAGIPSEEQLNDTQYQNVGAIVTSQTEVDLGGSAGLEVRYTDSANGVSVAGASLEVLTAPGEGCFVTISYQASIPSAILAEAISSFRLS